MSEQVKTPPADLEIFDAEISAICQKYLEVFPDEQERLAPLIEALNNPALDLRDRKTIPEGHLCASGIILSPKQDEVLMVAHVGLKIWVVPGGHYDLVDGKLSNAALREGEEETGLTNLTLHPWHLKHGIPLDIDTHPIPDSPQKNEGSHQHFDFRYVLEVPDYAQAIKDTATSLDPNEVDGVQSRPLISIDRTMSIAPAIAKISLGMLRA